MLANVWQRSKGLWVTGARLDGTKQTSVDYRPQSSFVGWEVKTSLTLVISKDRIRYLWTCRPFDGGQSSCFLHSQWAMIADLLHLAVFVGGCCRSGEE